MSENVCTVDGREWRLVYGFFCACAALYEHRRKNGGAVVNYADPDDQRLRMEAARMMREALDYYDDEFAGLDRRGGNSGRKKAA